MPDGTRVACHVRPSREVKSLAGPFGRHLAPSATASDALAAIDVAQKSRIGEGARCHVLPSSEVHERVVGVVLDDDNATNPASPAATTPELRGIEGRAGVQVEPSVEDRRPWP